MIEISRAQLDMLAPWFLPEAPGPVIAAHVIRTGFGHAWVDRWPDVQCVVAETNNNYIMVGDANALDPKALSKTVAGFVAAPLAFVPLLEATFPTLVKWPRIIGMLPDAPIQQPEVDAELRRFQLDDANDLEMLSAESIWVANTWGGGKPLAHSGYGWGAWVDGVLASVACTFFLGNDFEDIGVVTEPGYRRLGLSTACCYELCLDIIARGRKPSWSTSTDNIASWRIAEKLGFVHHRHDWLYVVGREVPKDT
jgi:RimJ/RimL family protein N-acetyltransferase